MIKVEYIPSPEEVVKTTLDFLMNRPILNMMFLFMKLSCVLLCVGFAITMYTKSTRPQDYAAILFAVLWLRFYKSINRSIISRSLKMRKLKSGEQSFNIDKQRIFYKDANNQPVHLEWKRVKFLLQDSDGYILPLTGLANSGKFLWFAKRGFTDTQGEQDFLELLSKLKVSVKSIR